ncbi:uncharacterized protein LOC141538115 [Cotesia typhae]|uniref:uncharacterized protein LOC141538115 n=1 Tax=Cotesia typhae TaxID=2053667 RepID=UPI003D684934
MQSKDSLATANALKKNWLNEIDAIVENGISSNNYSSSDDNNNTFSHPNTSVAKKPFESLLDEDSDDDNDDTMPSFIRKPFESLLDEDSEDDIEDDDDLYHDNHYPFENLTEVDDSSTVNNINDHNQNKINIDSNENFLQSENDWEGSNSFRDDQHYHHDYDVVSTSDGIVAYIAGYVARKFQRMTFCCECIETLRSANSSERDRVIELMSNGGLIFPSENLFRLIKKLEQIVLTAVGTKTVKINTMHQVLEKIAKVKCLAILGCDEHKKELTAKILNNFVIMRGNFLANLINRTLNERKMMAKKHRKISKLA